METVIKQGKKGTTDQYLRDIPVLLRSFTKKKKEIKKKIKRHLRIVQNLSSHRQNLDTYHTS